MSTTSRAKRAGAGKGNAGSAGRDTVICLALLVMALGWLVSTWAPAWLGLPCKGQELAQPASSWSVAALSRSARRSPLPRGQFQADLRTLLHAVEFVLTPEPAGAADLPTSIG